MDFSTLSYLGLAQAAFLVALLGSKKNRSLPDLVLAAWLSVLGVHHLLNGLYGQGVGVPAAMLNLSAGVPLLQGPFLFLYVDTLTSGRRLRPWDGLHLVPYLLFAGYVSLLLPRFAGRFSSTVSVFHLHDLATVALLVSVPVYALVALRRLRRHEADTLDRYSEQHGRDLTWLRRIVLALLALWVVVIATTVAPSWLPAGSGHRLMGSAALFVYAIGYFGWRQFAVADAAVLETDAVDGAVDGAGVESAESPVEAPKEGAPKYERSGLKEPEIEELVARLGTYMEDEQPYLEPELTLQELADGLETTPNRLSQAINQGMGKNFHELINERRVADFQSRVLDPRNRHRTLLAVAFDSGFSSKSSFNRVFKQMAGMSPRQYVQRNDQPTTKHG